MTVGQADYFSSATSYLGTIFRHLGKYDLSEQYHLRNITFLSASPSLAQQAEALIIGEKRLLAQLYAQTGKFKEAGNLYDESLEWGKENFL